MLRSLLLPLTLLLLLGTAQQQQPQPQQLQDEVNKIKQNKTTLDEVKNRINRSDKATDPQQSQLPQQQQDDIYITKQNKTPLDEVKNRINRSDKATDPQQSQLAQQQQQVDINITKQNKTPFGEVKNLTSRSDAATDKENNSTLMTTDAPRSSVETTSPQGIQRVVITTPITEEANASSAPCPRGFKLVNGSCEDVNECLSYTGKPAEQEEDLRDVCGNYVHSHRPGYRCVNTPGSYRCERIVDCGFGYVLNQTIGVCIDIDECAILGYQAACGTPLPIKVCINLEGTFRCEYRSCPPGKHLDRTTGQCNPCPRGYAKTLRGTCQDVNECERAQLNTCQPHMRCVNFKGGYECKDKIFCPMGRRANYNGTACIDIDECTEQPGICGFRLNCVNTDGDYRCEPKQCGKLKELSVQTGECVCVDGFRLNATSDTCEDINECAEGKHNCEPNDVCRNTRGHFDCLSRDKVCEPGFGLDFDRSTCVDIDECRLGQFKCGQNEFCNNTHGSYTCPCRQGFKWAGVSKECKDIDECTALSPAPCSAPLLCVNTVGSFACRCPAGYRLNVSDPRTACQDIDECSESPGICGPAGSCRNSPPGGYTCTCAPGYMANETVGGTCVDINECRLNACPPTAVCTNSPGGFTCACGRGFRYARESNVCDDIDECNRTVNGNATACPAGLSCFNYRGHFACYNSTCPDGFKMGPPQRSLDTLSFNCDVQNASCRSVASVGIGGSSHLSPTRPPPADLCVTRLRVVHKALEVSAGSGEFVTIQSDMRLGQRTCRFQALLTLSDNSTVLEMHSTKEVAIANLRHVQFKQHRLGRFTICSTNLKSASVRAKVAVRSARVSVAIISRRSAETSNYAIHIVRH